MGAPSIRLHQVLARPEQLVRPWRWRRMPGQTDYLASTTPYNWLFGQWAGRMDMNLTSKLRVFGRFTRNHFVEYRSDWTYFIVPGYNNTGANGTGVTRDDQNGVLDLVYTISPTTLLHAAGSVSNWMSYTTTLALRLPVQTLRCRSSVLPGCNCGTVLSAADERQRIFHQWHLRNPGSAIQPFLRLQRRCVQGPRQPPVPLRRGFPPADARQPCGNNDGTYGFGNTYFRQYDDGGPNGNYNPGHPGLELGIVHDGPAHLRDRVEQCKLPVSNQFLAFFAQDTWRVAPRFTLTLSLRAEWENGAKGTRTTGFRAGTPTPCCRSAPPPRPPSRPTPPARCRNCRLPPLS